MKDARTHKQLLQENKDANDELAALYNERDDYLRVLTNFTKGQQGELLSDFAGRVMRQSKKIIAKYPKI